MKNKVSDNRFRGYGRKFSLIALALMIGLSVAVIHASPAYAACGGDIRIGTSVSGRITSGACYYYFYGSAKQQVVITMRRSSTSLDPYLKLHDPNGKFLASDDDSGGQYDARISYRLPYKGWYRITATSYDGKDKGSFTLSAAQP